MIGKIVKIQQPSRLNDKIAYQFNEKIGKNQGELLANNCFSANRIYSIYNTIYQTGEINSKAKNKYAELILSLDPSEQLDHSTWLEIADKYMNHLGYTDTPHAIFLNSDEDHQHIHIITSAIDIEGNKVDQMYDYSKINAFNRQIEKEYNLKVPERDSEKAQESLNAINMRKYYFQNALKKGLKGYDTKHYLENLIDKDSREMIFNEQLNNKQMQILLGDNYQNIHQYLLKNGLFNTLYLDELKAKLNQIYNISTTKQDFLNRCKDNDIYVRKIYNKKGKPIFEYGLSGFYFKESSLPGKFRFNNLAGLDYDKTKNEFSWDEQKNYLKRNIAISLNNSNSNQDFYNNLSSRSIEVITHENSGGIYGLSFKSMNCSNPFVFKGSELGFSLNTIQKRLNTSEKNRFILPDQFSKPYLWNNNTPLATSTTTATEGPDMDSDQQEEEYFKKKHRKKQKPD